MREKGGCAPALCRLVNLDLASGNGVLVERRDLELVGAGTIYRADAGKLGAVAIDDQPMEGGGSEADIADMELENAGRNLGIVQILGDEAEDGFAGRCLEPASAGHEAGFGVVDGEQGAGVGRDVAG